ncbi:hypothetical protein CY34DRAFT_802966, partial [Suillus luteus UH-Slu-Lm8-n1]
MSPIQHITFASSSGNTSAVLCHVVMWLKCSNFHFKCTFNLRLPGYASRWCALRRLSSSKIITTDVPYAMAKVSLHMIGSSTNSPGTLVPRLSVAGSRALRTFM